MRHADGCDVMMNRVMTKDNIALAVLLETREAAWETAPSQPDQVSAIKNAGACILNLLFTVDPCLKTADKVIKCIFNVSSSMINFKSDRFIIHGNCDPLYL